MKSPLTGKQMIQMSESDTLEYKDKTYDVIHHFYLCNQTNEKFTTTELDELNLKELEYAISMQESRSN